MQLEIQVALNFVISFMYNKLPRRRVNIFAEELERALRFRFQSHWYPDRPCRGSAYRCLRTGDPLDPVLDVAARESGLALTEIRQNLPEDLSVWIDPGEVSYRIGEKGTVKLLYSEPAGGAERLTEERCDREVTSTFNPEAQCFRPIDALSASLGSLSMSAAPTGSPFGAPPAAASPAPFKSASPAPFAPQRPRAPVTFTTAAFAQTKFGSTKLKSSGKRGNRMSPTEFSNYIKQRAMLQQPALLTPFPQHARPLSPAAPPPPPQQQQPQMESFFASKMATAPPGMNTMLDAVDAFSTPPPRAPPGGGAMLAALTPESQQLLESLTYASSSHLQHLLVAN
ncbi:Protein Tob2 [Amphibalanus amphitrite]|uniref:Protein Tob2 n=1 Tax=Amphibalanus amphitrite TaxID=1232801 RepID=A0A6A4VJQ0_AMPAM|nr:protein Tob1-like [Amphibalanus amphitrite]XP_043210595.1 protein Tob1-like [Amphibalanus amphitrite]KAF0291530.1 Protein Tob2 [Amphibalanus amphitrite]